MEGLANVIHAAHDRNDNKIPATTNGKIQGECIPDIGRPETKTTWCRGWITPLATVSKDDVPPILREPNVEHGFRPIGQTWSYYLRSVFKLHNETMNIWTHLLALFLTIYKLIGFSGHMDFVNDRYTWPLLAGVLCHMMTFACSSSAHCFQSKSELVHYRSYMIDYTGIGLFGLGSAILHLWYCSEPAFYEAYHDMYIPMGAVMAFMISFCLNVTKVMYDRPYPFIYRIFQLAPPISISVLLLSPIVPRLLACYRYGENCSDSMPCHVNQIIWFTLTVLIYGSHIPDCLKHGMCDYFFHSHQLFHLTIMVATLEQMNGVFRDFQIYSDVIRSRPLPTFASTFAVVIAVFTAQVLCIWCFSAKIKQKISKAKKLQ